MKAILVYASVHHGNTKKIAEAMAQELGADLVDITKNKEIDLSAYNVIGLASGVFFHSMHEEIMKLIEDREFSKNQKVFTVTTCGVGYCNYAKGAARKLQEKGVCYLGNFQCRGYDTFGSFGKIGGIAKNHPNEWDKEKARKRESVILATFSAGDMIPSGPLARSAELRRTIPMSGIRKRQGNL